MDIGKWDILGLIAIGFLVYAVVASVYISSDDSSVQSNREINESLSTEEKVQLEKCLALEKDPEFLSAINNFVKSIHRESPPVMKEVIVKNMTSDTEAEVYLEVVYSTVNGEKASIIYFGNWTKSSGVWKAEDDFK
ncbi:MAG: hypothetical protein B655_2443 [Methanobacterium sp. Maddingley MBC34]|nr:MAG: hypothetical protein B655_2443 [Methanobacterium sp. Maddingley MBC34]